jgi:GAF domain-containing protein
MSGYNPSGAQDRASGQTTVEQQTQMQFQRERILSNVMFGMAILGTFLIISTAIRSIQEQTTAKWISLALFAVVYTWMLTITFVRRIPYKVRLIGLLAVLYVLGAVTMVQDGIHGNGRLYLLTLSIVTTLFYGLRGGLYGVVISVLTFLLAPTLFYFRILPAPEPVTNQVSDNLFFWLVAAVGMVAVTTTLTISSTTLIKGLETSLDKANQLAGDLNPERMQLEQKVVGRTQDLERRLTQIRTASEITRSIGTMLEQQTLLQQVADMVQQRFNLYHAGIFLIQTEAGAAQEDLEASKSKTGAVTPAEAESVSADIAGGHFASTTKPSTGLAAAPTVGQIMAQLKAGTGEAGQKLLADRFQLPVSGLSLISRAIGQRKAVLVADLARETTRPLLPYLPNSRCELALPLVSGTQVLGVLDLHADRTNAFDEDDITLLQGIADSLAQAMANALLFQQVQTSLEEIRSLNRQYVVQSWAEVAHRAAELSFTYEGRPATGARTTPADEAEATPKANIEIPLTLRQQVIGQLTLETGAADLSPEDKTFVDAVITQASFALENARLLEETQRRAAQERFLAEVASQVRASANIETILRTALQELSRSLRASEGLIQLQPTVTAETPAQE